MRGGDVARPRPRHPEDLIRVAPLVTFSPLLPPLVPSRPLSSLLVTRVQTQGAEQRKKVGGSICLKQQPAGGWAVVLDNFDIDVNDIQIFKQGTYNYFYYIKLDLSSCLKHSHVGIY